MIRGHFKSFVLKVCDSKGVADAILRKYINLKELMAKNWKWAVEGAENGNEEFENRLREGIGGSGGSGVSVGGSQ